MNVPSSRICWLLISIASPGLLASALAQDAAVHAPMIVGQVLPPITNADPSIRVTTVFKVPAVLAVDRRIETASSNDSLSVTLDPASFEATNLTVGTNMVTGVQSALCVYADGQSSPTNRSYGLGGPDFNLGVQSWNAKRDGLPLPGGRYVVEMELILFETDIPPQHMWRPQDSKNYRVLWQRTLKQNVVHTNTFLQKALVTVKSRLSELGCTGISSGPSYGGFGLRCDEFAQAGFFLSKSPRYLSYSRPGETPVVYHDLDVTVCRFKSADDALQGLEKSLEGRSVWPSSTESYKSARLYRFSSGVGHILCQSGPYFLEIQPLTEGASPFVVQVLDILLGELETDSSKPK